MASRGDVEVRRRSGGELWRAGLLGLRRCTVLWGLSFRGAVLSLWLLLVFPLVGTGPGAALLAGPLRRIRRLADRHRALALEWTGTVIPSAYVPSAHASSQEGQGQRQEPRQERSAAAARLLVRDTQEWRDRRWIAWTPLLGGPLAFGPLGLLLSGALGLALLFTGVPLAKRLDAIWYLFVPVDSPFTAVLAGLLGLVQLPLALWAAPHVVRWHARQDRALLAPGESALMADRIAHLTATRSDAVDASATELRRIERDLHDGAQARLVAMGMTLDAATHLLERDPQAVRTLLVEARESSNKALEELRDLVRGIHPPILADRGLADAVRSLAMLSPLETEVRVDLPARPDPPVESAAYFAVSEILANAAKHAGAGRVWLDLRHEDGKLRVDVTDDGLGGADRTGGTGLRGIERRLAAFDGVLAVHSPVGGPTILTMELPCALSSRKTTSS